MENRDVIKPLFMTLFGAGVGLKGLEDWLHAGTTLFGFLTAVIGFCAAVCGLIWWLRRLKKDKKP